MSNQRETIIAYIPTLLDGISTGAGFNTTPYLYRERTHWDDKENQNLSALFVDEGEPEEVSTICFGKEQGVLNLIILGRYKGTWSNINNLLEDVRKRLESSSNTYQKDTEIVSVKVSADPNSELKEFEMNVKISYRYNLGSA
jgi:hypothetical protein